MRKIRLVFSYFLVFLQRKVFNAHLLQAVSKNKTKILGALCLLLLLFAGVWYFRDSLTRKYIREGIIGTYDDKDLPTIVTKLLSQGLIKLDESGMPTGDLAQSWQSSQNETVFTIKLKPNLLWVDGSPISAKDLTFDLPNVKVSYPDDTTVQFKLSDPYSPFPTLLTNPTFKRNSFIGTGPYYIHQIQRDHSIIKRLILYPQDPSQTSVVINFYPNEHQAEEALKLGQVQSILGITDVTDLKGQKNLVFSYKNNFTELVTIFYNTADPVLADDNLRLALSYGAPSIPGETEAITSIPQKSWAFNPDVKNYLDNTDQAKAALKKVKKGLDQPIVLTATSNLADVGQQVVEAWQKLGIKAQLRVESGIPQNFQALLITHTIPADPDQYALWHSTQTQTNLSKFSNPRIDQDLEVGRTATDSAVRKAKYQDFQKILLDHAPATFLYFPKYTTVYLKKVEPDVQKLFSLQLSAF